MKKIVYKSLQLAALSVIAYLTLACILNITSIRGRSMASWATSYIQRIGEQEFYTFRDLDSSTTRYDFIALGSSHAMHGYDPRIFRKHGYELFNFGSSNQHSQISYVLAKYYLDRPEKPVFLIDVYHAVYEGSDWESAFRYIANAPDTKAAWHIFKDHRDVRTWNAFVSRIFRDELKADLDCKRYVENGFCSNTDTIKTNLVALDPNPDLKQVHFDGLDSLINLIQSRGSNVILVAHPMTNAPEFSNVHKKFIEKLNPIISKYHVPFIDHTLEKYLNDKEHFYNQTHLNQAGIDIYNDRLFKELEKRNLLPNKPAL
jgi:hypothetical protein